MVRLAHSSLPTPTPTSLSGLLRTRGILIKSSLSSRMPRTPAGSTLSSGSRDSMIHNHDVRSAQDVESTLRGHRQEVCGLKWSPDGKLYFNFSSWSPNWSAVCWYDLVLLRRTSPLYAPLALDAAKLPRPFCKRLQGGWYPWWVQRPPPTEFDCAVEGLKRGEVCYCYLL